MVRQEQEQLSQSQIVGNVNREKNRNKQQEMYFITHYVTPKKQIKLKPHAIQKVTSVTNLKCISSREQAPTTNSKCKKSLSLQDLSPSFQKHLTKRRALLCPKRFSEVTIMTGTPEILDERTKIIAFRVLYMFSKNVWRKQKAEAEIKDVYLKSTTSQVANLKIQVSTMKSLLKSDEQVISNSFKEIHTLKTLITALQEQYSSLKTEKEGLEQIVNSAKEELDEVKTESLNDKNALILSKSEASALEAQLQKERDKINKLKEENRELLDKVDEFTVSLKLKNEEINCLNQTIGKMQQQTNSHLSLLRTAEQKILQYERALEETSGSVKKLRKELGEAALREGKVKAQVEDTKIKLAEQARHFDQILKEKSLKILELVTDQAMNSPKPLKTKVLRYATYAIGEALVILRAFSSG